MHFLGSRTIKKEKEEKNKGRKARGREVRKEGREEGREGGRKDKNALHLF